MFSYGSGTTVNVSDTTITTTKDNSGGIQTTGGAAMNATNLTVNTAGIHQQRFVQTVVEVRSR